MMDDHIYIIDVICRKRSTNVCRAILKYLSIVLSRPRAFGRGQLTREVFLLFAALCYALGLSQATFVAGSTGRADEGALGSAVADFLHTTGAIRHSS